MQRHASALYASQVDTVLELCLHIYVPTDSLSNCLGEWGRVGVYAIPVNEFLLIQYYDYVFIIFEVLMYTFLLISQSAVCSPLSVRYGAVEMTTIFKVLLVEMYVNVVFVIRCLYCAVSLTVVRE